MNMIEKVARAMVPPYCDPWETKGFNEQQSYMEAAERAIKAMKEPTHTMIERGCNEHLHSMSHGSTYQMIEAAYESMIDGALVNTCQGGDRE